MNPEHREEMISAYLDGELSKEERAQVEAWLAESPELRQLHDELKTLGATIQALPRHQLQQNIHAAVVRRAEQAILSGGAAPGAIERDVRPASRAPLWLRGAGWRRLAWPAVAVAAALVVMFFDSQETPAPREVAQAPSGPTAISARPEAPAAAVTRNATGETSTAAPGQNAAARAKPATAMLRDASSREEASGGTAVSATESAPTARGTATAMGRAVPALKDTGSSAQPSMDVIVYRVSTEFLRDNTLEKILAERQIAWTADRPDAPAFGYRFKKSDEPVVAESLAMKASSPLERKVYTLRVTDEQRATILAELDAKPNQIKKTEMLTRNIAAADKRSEEEATAPKERTEADGAVRSQAGEKRSGSVLPLTIVLEAPAAAPTAAESTPAVPADGKAKP